MHNGTFGLCRLKLRRHSVSDEDAVEGTDMGRTRYAEGRDSGLGELPNDASLACDHSAESSTFRIPLQFVVHPLSSSSYQRHSIPASFRSPTGDLCEDSRTTVSSFLRGETVLDRFHQGESTEDGLIEDSAHLVSSFLRGETILGRINDVEHKGGTS
eukprot:1683812-Pleurochrysis_carterae.AAC.1